MKKPCPVKRAIGWSVVVGAVSVAIWLFIVLPNALQFGCYCVRPGMHFEGAKAILNPIAGPEVYDGELGSDRWYWWHGDRGSVWLCIDIPSQRVKYADWHGQER